MANRLGIRGRTVEMFVRFVDTAGNPVNADDTPKVKIADSNGLIWRSFSNVGVSLVDDPGLYKLEYEIPLNFIDGYANDFWRASIGGTEVETTFEFLVISAGTLTADEEPTNTPGDPFLYNFSKEEVVGINKLLKILKKRLKNDGIRKVPDGEGGYIEEKCVVFSDSELICFLVNSLSEFNAYPHFTNFSFADSAIQDLFLDITIQGAVLLALAAQALIEKGREFVITDNGVNFQPPQIAELLNNQFSTQLADYKEKLKMIKASLKPSPMGLGTFRVTSIAPAYLRLRHLRQRQVI